MSWVVVASTFNVAFDFALPRFFAKSDSKACYTAQRLQRQDSRSIKLSQREVGHAAGMQ